MSRIKTTLPYHTSAPTGEITAAQGHSEVFAVRGGILIYRPGRNTNLTPGAEDLFTARALFFLNLKSDTIAVAFHPFLCSNWSGSATLL